MSGTIASLMLALTFSFQSIGIGSTSTVPSNSFVVITNPTNGSKVSGTIPITAEASAGAGVAMVDFLVDGERIASDSAYPYSVPWNTTSLIPGSWHQLIAFVYDYLGIGSSSSVTNVQIAPTPAIVPTVFITNPASGSMVKRGAVITIIAQARDNQGIKKVEFYVNNKLTCTDSTSSYTCAWRVPARDKTSYTLTAKAYNLAGNTASSSIRVRSR